MFCCYVFCKTVISYFLLFDILREHVLFYDNLFHSFIKIFCFSVRLCPLYAKASAKESIALKKRFYGIYVSMLVFLSIIPFNCLQPSVRTLDMIWCFLGLTSYFFILRIACLRKISFIQGTR